MNRQSIYAARLGVLVLVTVFVIAGCNAASRPTAIEAGSTPTPTPTTAPSTAPTGAPSATAAEATAAPSASATAAPSASPAASATPIPVAGTCTGTADHLAFFADAAAKLPFDVYCLSLIHI